MNNEQQSNAPEQYFSTIDEIPNPHDVAIAAISENIHQDMFPLPAYMPLGTDARSQVESFFHLTDAAGHPTPSDMSTYGFHHVPDSTSAGYQTSHDWHQAGHHIMFSNPAPTAGPGDASLSNLDYMPYGEQHQGVHGEAFPSSFEHGYVPQSNLDHSASYAYDWNAHSAQASEHDLASSHSGTGHESTLVSPIETRTRARTPSSFTSTSSGGRYSSMYAGTTNVDPQVVASTGSGSVIAPGRAPRESTAASKKGKAWQKPSNSRRSSGKAGAAPAPPGSIFASSSGESSLSGAGPSSSRGSRSSTSSYVTQPLTERLDEKKTRGTHNLVEKQYRNRLNARFEDLMNALPPESLRPPASGLGDRSDATAAADAAARRASKAEVLELARQHIQQLEQQRDTLARERDELLGTSQRLQEIQASQSPAHGRTSERGAGNDDEGEEEDAEESGHRVEW